MRGESMQKMSPIPYDKLIGPISNGISVRYKITPQKSMHFSTLANQKAFKQIEHIIIFLH